MLPWHRVISSFTFVLLCNHMQAVTLWMFQIVRRWFIAFSTTIAIVGKSIWLIAELWNENETKNVRGDLFDQKNVFMVEHSTSITWEHRWIIKSDSQGNFTLFSSEFIENFIGFGPFARKPSILIHFHCLGSLYITTKAIHHRSAWDFFSLLLVYDPFLIIILMIPQLFNSLTVLRSSPIGFTAFTWLSSSIDN